MGRCFPRLAVVLVALLFAAVVPSVHAVRKEQEAEGTEAEEAVVPSVHADDAEKIGAEEGSEQEAEGTEAEEAVVPSVHADDAEKTGAEEGSEQEAKAEEALKHLDTDGDGFVSLNEMLQDLGETVSSPDAATQKLEHARLLSMVLVDTVELCQAAVAQLFQEKEVAIDIEGVDLSRAGEVCLIQMCGSSNPTVYLFDIHVLKQSAFEEGGLKQLLESEQVTKLFHDVRGDNDALHHLHDVKVRGAYDIQVLWHVKFQNSEDIYLQGLKKVLALFLEQSKVLTRTEALALDRLKEMGLKMFAPDLGGSYEVWKQRPLRPELVEYAAADVKFLLGMRSLWAPEDKEVSEALDRFVKDVSAVRLQKFVALPRSEALNYPNNKFRDFEIPEGFNDTGDIIEKVPVPSHKRGRVIGRGGATIRRIQSRTGARVTLDGSYALVIGQPAQVQAAVRQIRSKLA